MKIRNTFSVHMPFKDTPGTSWSVKWSKTPHCIPPLAPYRLFVFVITIARRVAVGAPGPLRIHLCEYERPGVLSGPKRFTYQPFSSDKTDIPFQFCWDVFPVSNQALKAKYWHKISQVSLMILQGYNLKGIDIS